jgi:RNA polymerase sigma factor (sigma-70 family)
MSFGASDRGGSDLDDIVDDHPPLGARVLPNGIGHSPFGGGPQGTIATRAPTPGRAVTSLTANVSSVSVSPNGWLADTRYSMGIAPPESLQRLLSAGDQGERDRCWAAFLAEFSALILYTARSLGGERDAAMDRYTFVLDALQAEDCRRLRRFTTEGSGKFTTWLVAVARRLCVDEHRRRYGRRQGPPQLDDRWRERRHLVDLIAAEVEVSEVSAGDDGAPDEAIRRAELSSVLQAALQRLETSDRLLLRLRFEDGRSAPEIARLVDAPSPFHVYRRIDRLLAMLRAELTAAGIESSRP